MKTNEQLLLDFEKANKERRVKIAEKAGFSTTEEYVNHLTAPPKKKVVVKTVKGKEKKKAVVDYVVAFDTTGSMGLYIGNVKEHVTKLIPEMFSQGIDLKMRIIAFGDYCDMIREHDFGNAYQQSDFTDNQKHLITFVKNAKNTNGGDSDEFYELVIKKIVEETPWRKDATKTVLFIADCGPHDKSYSWFGQKRNIDWKEEAKKAKKANITFDTLSIHGDKYKWYKKLADITGGVYMPFQSSNKMSEVVTASLYVRGSEASRDSFTASYTMAIEKGDEELIGVYKSLSTLL